jgi:hypothetical protein
MEKLRTIGLKPETHRALKQLCAANEWTMTEAVQHMMERLEEMEKDGTGLGTGGESNENGDS